MRQQAPVRQPDETICLRCGQVIKRDVRICPECGTRIAVGPKQAEVPANYEAARPATRAATRTATRTATLEDEVGAGRYILNFVLAGIVGLVLSYFLRRQGWLATWICIPIFIIGVVYLINTGGPSP